MSKKRALITGVTGQDGSYLSEFLLEKGYEVHGIKRRSSSFNTSRIDHLYQDPHEVNRDFVLHHGDLTDASSINRIIREVHPDEIYNLAIKCGASGGKVIGSGGGGFVLVYCKKKYQKKLFKNFNKLPIIKFKFVNKGSEIIFKS